MFKIKLPFKNPFGVKLIYHNYSNLNLPDDGTMPYRLEVIVRGDDFMQVARMGLGIAGPEKIVVLGNTRLAINRIVWLNGYDKLQHLISLTITGPDGVELELPKEVVDLEVQAAG